MRKTICLNMIVKNECSAIRNCLASIKGIIDTWVIADTGSEDGTQEIIREVLQGIPGELHEIPWVDFASCRNTALNFARGKADYILFIDADEEIATQEGFEKDTLGKDAYFIRTKGPATDHFRILLIRDDPRWRWEGAIHEHLVHDWAVGEVLPTLINFCRRTDGRRSQDANKYLFDAHLLEKKLREHPGHPRLLFYLAQSYGNAGEFALAHQIYRQRASLPGPAEETFWALYCIGHMEEHLGAPFAQTVQSFCKAYAFAPDRAEPIERMASDFLKRGWPLLTYLLARFTFGWQVPTAIQSNVHSWVYEYAMVHLAAESRRELQKMSAPLTFFRQ